MKIIKLTGEVEVLTGLHIGGGDDTMKIGGIDNQVIKDVNTNKPYIPGSSLKGKMRSLLEWNLGLVGVSNGDPFDSSYLEDVKFQNEEDRQKAKTFLKLFGDKTGESGITRANFGDCSLIEIEDQIVTEGKWENVIDREKGTASNPRQTERVPSGVKFRYDIRVKIMDEYKDDEDTFKELIKRGLTLLENDYLGGSGSRGYGRVSFANKENWEEINL